MGAANATFRAVPHLVAAGGGAVVNVSSRGAFRGEPNNPAYGASKAGMNAFAQSMAIALAPHGISVTCVAPGFVRSNPTTERQWDAMGEAGQTALLQGIAMRRLGTVEDIANAVLFLASEQAGWITGETLGVDGGK